MSASAETVASTSSLSSPNNLRCSDKYLVQALASLFGLAAVGLDAGQARLDAESVAVFPRQSAHQRKRLFGRLHRVSLAALVVEIEGRARQGPRNLSGRQCCALAGLDGSLEVGLREPVVAERGVAVGDGALDLGAHVGLVAELAADAFGRRIEDRVHQLIVHAARAIRIDAGQHVAHEACNARGLRRFGLGQHGRSPSLGQPVQGKRGPDDERGEHEGEGEQAEPVASNEATGQIGACGRQGLDRTLSRNRSRSSASAAAES